MGKKRGKLVDLSIQKTSYPYKEDKVIIKILFIKKSSNLVKIKEEKLKDIANKKTLYSRG